MVRAGSRKVKIGEQFGCPKERSGPVFIVHGNPRCFGLGTVLSSAIMRTQELEYRLPEALIAQHPVPNRDESRLLVVDRAQKTFRENIFRNLPDYLDSGDCIALNDTRVIRARLHGIKPTGGRVELFLLRELQPGRWRALVRPSARVAEGTVVRVGRDHAIPAVIGATFADGTRSVAFDHHDVIATLEAEGDIPLPPYVQRSAAETADAERYQTVYARAPGAVAAPTAGLHFTPEVFEALDRKGVGRAPLTLHVGYGTFKPIQTDTLEAHEVAAESFHFPESSAAKLNATREARHQIVAVGTTTCRVLESRFENGRLRAGEGETDLYIYPPHEFQAVDRLLTNFHLPQSSLLALVCAFAGTEFMLEAYRHAVEQEFRFYSYGDAMLIL